MGLQANSIESNAGTGVSIKPVISLTELRATTNEQCKTDNFMLMMVAGVLTIWQWNAASTATDDGVSVVKATVIATGRWLKSSASFDLATEFNGSNQDVIGNDGFQKLPGGLIMQWGKGLTAGAGAASITFPMAFPNTCFNVVATGAADNVSTSVSAVTAAGFNASSISSISTPAISNYNGYFYWQAIGN